MRVLPPGGPPQRISSGPLPGAEPHVFCKAKPVKLKKVAFSHFFDTLSTLKIQSAVIFMHLDELDYGHLGSVATTGTHLEDAGVAAVASLVLGGDLVE